MPPLTNSNILRTPRVSTRHVYQNTNVRPDTKLRQKRINRSVIRPISPHNRVIPPINRLHLNKRLLNPPKLAKATGLLIVTLSTTRNGRKTTFSIMSFTSGRLMRLLISLAYLATVPLCNKMNHRAIMIFITAIRGNRNRLNLFRLLRPFLFKNATIPSRTRIPARRRHISFFRPSRLQINRTTKISIRVTNCVGRNGVSFATKGGAGSSYVIPAMCTGVGRV